MVANICLRLQGESVNQFEDYKRFEENSYIRLQGIRVNRPEGYRHLPTVDVDGRRMNHPEHGGSFFLRNATTYTVPLHRRQLHSPP
jgi:hypothetical protein